MRIRDITLFLGGDDPELLIATSRTRSPRKWRACRELRAPRVEGDLAQPEITIKPRFDLAADLGVTTAALSQTIRIATLGDIEQNSAKFSLADRQVPIKVSLSENARRDLSTLENLPVPTSSGGSVPLKSVADIGFGSGPTTVQRTEPDPPHSRSALISRPGVVRQRRRGRRSTSCRRSRTCRRACRS